MVQAITCKGAVVQRRNSAPERADCGIVVENVLSKSALLGYVAAVLPFFHLSDGCSQVFFVSASEVIKIS